MLIQLQLAMHLLCSTVNNTKGQQATLCSMILVTLLKIIKQLVQVLKIDWLSGIPVLIFIFMIFQTIVCE